jgi:hypothetical protein
LRTGATSASAYLLPVVLLNDAETLLSEDMVTVQVSAVPEHAPLQPANVYLLAGAAFSVTVVPLVVE